MIRKGGNFAFIDNQNLYMETRRCGGELDYERFLVYLREKYAVERAFLFLGYLENKMPLYEKFHQFGYELIFKKVSLADAAIKGNCDADLVLHAVFRMDSYDQAVIVSGDGDFHGLVEYLVFKNKLKRILAPHSRSCSTFLKGFAGRIDFLDSVANQLALPEKMPANAEA